MRLLIMAVLLVLGLELAEGADTLDEICWGCKATDAQLGAIHQ